MSKRKYFGGELDLALRQPTNRMPAYRVYLWNPNRTDIHEVVLGHPKSPRYDVTDWVIKVDFNENIVFENNDDAVATSAMITLIYDPSADPVQITEKTFLDGAPIQIWQGDKRIPVSKWVPIFTGVCRGVPTTEEHTRDDSRAPQLVVSVVDRAEKYLNKVVTARSYEKGEDVGKAAVETAIEWMYMDRREVKIGEQGYEIAHKQSQLVDIEVLKGIAQILFCTGKKPRFDCEGFLVAADTDLNRPPARRYTDRDHVSHIKREQVLTSINNSVRLLGLDDELTRVVEQVKRLAHGNITAGFFEDEVRDEIFFSENDGKEKQGRRAKNTFLENEKVSTIGDFFGESLTWEPTIEEDGVTVFSGHIIFDTGYDSTIRIVLMGTWAAAMILAHIARSQADAAAASSTIPTVAAAEAAAALWDNIAQAAETAADLAMIGIILSLTEIGRVYWEVHGEPFQEVYQQIAATAQLSGILTEDIKEVEFRNDWIYDLDYAAELARELLRRELIKGWGYEIEMIDDPLIECDDIIDIDGLRFYVTSIRKTLMRPGNGTMRLTAWRIR